MMVLVASRSVGRMLPRAEQTKDADVLVDVCADPKTLRKVAHQLDSLGFKIPRETWDSPDMARCTFVSGNSQIDVLCPDDARPEDLDLGDSIRSLAIPGGRRALEMAETVHLRYAEEYPDVEVRVPLLEAAIVVKAHAVIDPRTSEQPRHGEDLTGMLSIIDDPVESRSKISDDDVALMSAAAQVLADDTHSAWGELSTDDRLRARAALDFMSG
jgi:hypothetical protein